MTNMIFKCEICRQVYILRERPSNCPFCGSLEEHVKPVDNVPDIEEYKLTKISIKNILEAIGKEYKAYNLYVCTKEKSESNNIKNKFNVTEIHEKWHYNLLMDEINIEEEKVYLIEDDMKVKCTNSDEENRRIAMIAEADAIVNYKKYLKEATEPRVKMVFAALLEVEQMHLDLIS